LLEQFDVLVIGGGPAGMAAAARAAECGARVGIVDDNPTLGGQIWRGESGEAQEKQEGRAFSSRSMTTICTFSVTGP